MNKPDSHPPHIPDWKLERFLLGELPPPELRDIRSRVDAHPDLAARVQALREERAGLLASHPAAEMATGIASRLRNQGQARPAAAPGYPRNLENILLFLRGPRVGLWAPAFGMVLVLALLPFTPFSPFSPPAGAGPDTGETRGETTRLKGLEPRLILYRKTGQGPQKLRSGETARTGDLVQVHYESAGRSFGALFSLDAEGKVTRHLPDRGSRSVTLRGGGPVALDFAYELDDAAGWERFYLVTSDRPFSLDSVEDALKRNFLNGAAGNRDDDSLSLPEGLEQAKFILLKESGT